jgi:ribosomal-protein-alanine N-acetyltransferase
MKLLTERLVLRRFTAEDFDDWYPLDQDPRVMKYIWACKPKPVSVEEAHSRLNYVIAYYDRYPGLGVFATCLRDTGELIGWTALKDLDGSEHIELGYRYFFDHWGKGYATEAGAALMEHGFSVVGLKSITAVTHPEHERSQRVLAKLGFRFLREDNFYNTDVHFFEAHRLS